MIEGANAYTLRKVKATRNVIQGKEKYVLNYFFNRLINAAVSLISKIKEYWAHQHGIVDIPFFLSRVCAILAGTRTIFHGLSKQHYDIDREV